MTSVQLKILVSLSLVCFTSANYHIAYVIRNTTFKQPMKTLFDGSCCDSSCGADQACCAASSGCSPTLRLCFRESQHSKDDTNSTCSLLQNDRTFADQRFTVMGTDNPPIEIYYEGGFQVYIRISHSEDDTPDFAPPFTDPLIDEAFLDFPNLPAASYDGRFSAPPALLTANGMFELVTVQMQATVHCAKGWTGPACEEESSCTSDCRVLTAPPIVTPEVTTAALPLSPQPLAPNNNNNNNNNNNIIPIAVGVSVGVVILILLVICLTIIIIVAVKRKMTWRRTFKPDTAAYTVKSKSNQKVMKADIQVVPTTEPLNRNIIYASINKKKTIKVVKDDEEPPQVPPYCGNYMEEYVPVPEGQGTVYENCAVLTEK